MTSQVVQRNWSVLPERSRVKFFGLNITYRKKKKTQYTAEISSFKGLIVYTSTFLKTPVGLY